MVTIVYTQSELHHLLADLGTCWTRKLLTMHDHIVDGLSTKGDTK